MSLRAIQHERWMGGFDGALQLFSGKQMHPSTVWCIIIATCVKWFCGMLAGEGKSVGMADGGQRPLRSFFTSLLTHNAACMRACKESWSRCRMLRRDYTHSMHASCVCPALMTDRLPAGGDQAAGAKHAGSDGIIIRSE